jgi:AraC-like DNA-binding protein
MVYETPTVYCEGELTPALERLLGDMPSPLPTIDWRVKRLVRFIDKQDGKLGWNLNHICEQLELGVSGSHSAKLFKQHTGIGIREYAKKRRLTVAAGKLKETTNSVKEIAIELGYRTPNDLRRQFKQLFYLSPSEFRTVYRQADQSGRANGSRKRSLRAGGTMM